MTGQPVAEAYRGSRPDRGRKVNRSRATADCVAGGCRLPRIEPRVVDARADIGTEPGRLVKETVCEQERRSEPPRGGDDLSVVRHRSELCRSLTLGLGQWRGAHRKL